MVATVGRATVGVAAVAIRDGVCAARSGKNPVVFLVKLWLEQGAELRPVPAVGALVRALAPSTGD